MDTFSLIAIVCFLLGNIAVMSMTKNNKANIIFSLLIMIILILLSGLRSGLGDTVFYVHSYNLIGPDYDIMNGTYEPGFCFLLKVLKSISPDPQFMILVTSLIINTLNIWIIRKYSEDWFELSVFLYITTYYIVTMNGIRQSIAAALIFASTPLIVNKKVKTYCLLMIFFLVFHESTFIMIPLYFVATRKAWSKEIWTTIVLFVIGMFFYDPLMKIIFSVMGDSKYAGYSESTEGGANIIRIFIFFIPVLLSYLGRDKLKQWKYSDVFINMTLINFIIMAFSYFNWIFARFNIYTQLYTVVALPFLIKKCFAVKERRLLYYGVIVFYLLFFIIDNNMSGVIYRSDFKLIDLLY